MPQLRDSWKLGGVLAGFSLLAACGGGGAAPPTNTVAPAPTTRPATAAATGVGVARTVTPAPGAATRTVPGVTRTTAAGTAVTRTVTTGPLATRGTASPTSGAVPPGQAYLNLQRLDNHRQMWVFNGFALGGLSGEIRVIYEFNGNNQHLVVNSAGATATEAYRIGDRFYTRAPVGGFVESDASSPLAAPAQTLFDVPKTILTNLIPPTAQFAPSGTETVNGRAATRYTGNVALADLGFVNPSLQGQRGTSATTIWVANDGGYIVATEAAITTEAASATGVARLRLDVTDVGQVGPITPPR